MMRSETVSTVGSIDVAGLGPGRAGLMTRESWELIKGAERLMLRTEIHPTVKALREAGIAFESYDHLYETLGSFEALYEAIAKDLIQRAEHGEKLVYAVPGSPFVAERTVSLLRKYAKGRSIALRILPGMSFLEVMYSALGIDPIVGLAILDAETMEGQMVSCNMAMVITQIYDKRVASETKLYLMDRYPDEYEIIYLHHLSLEDEDIRPIPLYELDRQPDIDHLTCIFVPAVE